MSGEEEYIVTLDESEIADLAARYIDDVMPGLVDIFVCRHTQPACVRWIQDKLIVFKVADGRAAVLEHCLHLSKCAPARTPA